MSLSRIMAGDGRYYVTMLNRSPYMRPQPGADFPFRQSNNAAGIAPAAQSAGPSPRGIQSFTGSMLRSLFRSPRRHTAADHKRDHDGKKDSEFHHAFLRRPAWGGIKSCAVTLTA
jgi:hypothetical protein